MVPPRVRDMLSGVQSTGVGQRTLTSEERLEEDRMNGSEQVEVAVVGAGPTGLALAIRLRAAGCDVAVLDQAPTGMNTSRAAVIHARTLEVLEPLDVTRRLIPEGIVVPVFTLHDRARVLATLDFSGLPTAYPYTLMLPQSRTEAILGERLAELGGSVRRPWQVTGITTREDLAVIAGRDAQGREQSLTAQYMVGADGMHSVVRESTGI